LARHARRFARGPRLGLRRRPVVPQKAQVARAHQGALPPSLSSLSLLLSAPACADTVPSRAAGAFRARRAEGLRAARLSATAWWLRVTHNGAGQRQGQPRRLLLRRRGGRARVSARVPAARAAPRRARCRDAAAPATPQARPPLWRRAGDAEASCAGVQVRCGGPSLLPRGCPRARELPRRPTHRARGVALRRARGAQRPHHAAALVQPGGRREHGCAPSRGARFGPLRPLARSPAPLHRPSDGRSRDPTPLRRLVT
jgi:hypothetical protein